MKNLSRFENNQKISNFTLGRKTYYLIDLPNLFGKKLIELPVVLRLLLENILRNTNDEECDAAVASIFDWLQSGTSNAEIAFQPNRVLMHDTTSTPALVDIAAMRNTLEEQGVDPSVLNPTLPVDISVDHSIPVEFFGHPDAANKNLQVELRRNKERYSFLQWASKVLRGVRIHPPGTGIMHTINLEQLATVVSTEIKNNQLWAIPDTLIGTDSHTPMINGIGVLGWGVGGLEAQTVMFGMPTMLRIPEVVGVKLIGKLPIGSFATDLALTVTHQLRKLDVTGAFVEFYGLGVSSLTAGQRSVIANMAPEYGATTGFFPVDQNTLNYLYQTNRKIEDIALVEAFTKRAGLWFNPEAEPTYTKQIEIDLSAITTQVAGPRRPQDILPFSETRIALSKLGFTPESVMEELPKHPIAIAAITSCTNTSDPALLIAAGLVARKARKLGLQVPSWVKTSLAPGSPAAASYLKRAGLMEDLAALGFDIVGYGCTTCIGNSGPLIESMQAALAQKAVYPVAMLSGNRNFPGRIHTDLDLAFLMSPPLVIAFALAGDAEADLSVDPIQVRANGNPVYLKDLWPTPQEIDQLVTLATTPKDITKAFIIASSNSLWDALKSPETPLYPWDAKSTALRKPPFAELTEGSLLGNYNAYPLMVVGDDVTTDHISPASAIPKTSLVADFLVAQGEDPDDLNVFASRRGNWEVMVRATFYNKTLINLLAKDAPIAHTLHIPSGKVLPVFEAAEQYKAEETSVILIAGERYGTGSSRDWAAKGQRLLGIRAVIAVSFERIHRSNLIGMGILPLCFPNGVTPISLNIQQGDQFEIFADSISPRKEIAIYVKRVDGTIEEMSVVAAVETQLEAELLSAGGVIPSILKQTLATYHS